MRGGGSSPVGRPILRPFPGGPGPEGSRQRNPASGDPRRSARLFSGREMGEIPRLRFVQDRPQDVAESFRGVRLVQETLYPNPGRMGSAGVRAQSARRDDLDRWIDPFQGLNQGLALHNRHHDVSQHHGGCFCKLRKFHPNASGLPIIRSGFSSNATNIPGSSWEKPKPVCPVDMAP
jgi:hypothetical protein